jgi:diadenosine tetraphosphatase ApaH/serine/threonine PP2A family protein phosphatase
MDLLQTLSLRTVRGNHDRWLTDDDAHETAPIVEFTRSQLAESHLETLRGLPPTLRPADDILAVHGTPVADTEYLLEELVDGRLALATPATIARRLGTSEATLVLCGHSHHQHMVQAAGDITILNPGSVGEPRYAGNPNPVVAEAGSPHARYAIATRRGVHWQCEMHAIPYDWAPVVHRARENGLGAWAKGFLRG